MNIEIAHQQDGLNQEKWRFMYLDTRHTLVLTEYQKQERSTSRHKFSNVEEWSAYGDRRYTFTSKRLPQPPLPENIKTKAIEDFVNSLKITIGFEEAR